MRKYLKKFTSTGRSKPTQYEKNDRSHVAVVPVVDCDARDEDIHFMPPRASLEGLPVEIQSSILLSFQDIASVKNLIHASPRYHSAYLSQRLEVLKRILFNSIHPDVLYDAFFAISSRQTQTSDPVDRVTRVNVFLSEYKDSRDTWTCPEHLDLESVLKLAQLQKRVQRATEDFCQAALSSHPFTGSPAQHLEQLSSNENRRFYRAFYRFEIFDNLFRNPKDSTDDGDLSDASSASDESTSEPESTEKSSRFLGLFNPWEVEELACVRDYFCNYYRRMLLRFEPDLRRRNPRLDLSEDGPWLEDNVEYLMALGLRFYQRMESSPPGRQILYLDRGLRVGSPFLSDALKVPPHAAVYQTLAGGDPVEVHFNGDSVSDGPNMMWLWTTNYKTDFGYFLWQNEPLRNWAYVFWDQKRLQKWDVPGEEYDTWVERRRDGLRKALAERS